MSATTEAAQRVVIDRLGRVPVAGPRRDRGDQRVDHRLLRRLDHRLEERGRAGVGELGARERLTRPRIDAVAGEGREGDHVVTAPIRHGRPDATEAEESALRQAFGNKKSLLIRGLGSLFRRAHLLGGVWWIVEAQIRGGHFVQGGGNTG